MIGAHHDHLGPRRRRVARPGPGRRRPPRRGRQRERRRGAPRRRARVRGGGARAADPPLRRLRRGGARPARLGPPRAAVPPAGCPVERMQLMVNLDMVGRPRERQGVRRRRRHGEGAARRGPRRRGPRAARPPRARVRGRRRLRPLRLHELLRARRPRALPVLGRARRLPPPVRHRGEGRRGGLAAVARPRVPRRAGSGGSRRPPRGRPRRGGRRRRRAESERGYGTYLGAIPDFAERTEPGVLLTGVRAGEPGRAGGPRRQATCSSASARRA